MNRLQIKVGTIVFNCIFTLFLCVFIVFAVRFGSCFGAAERIPHTENYEVMRILLYGSSSTESGDTVSAVISLLDTAGNECAVIERSWKGSSLAVDFSSAEFSGKRLLFPQAVYGRESFYERRGFAGEKSGTSLAHYYNENGQCMLFGTGTTYENRQDLYRLSRFALSPASFLTAGFSKKYTADLSRCETGVYYSIVTDSRGKLEIRRD